MAEQKRKQSLIPENELLGTISWGINKTGIFLSLCKVYREFDLDIIDVDSHVTKGWFIKMILARNKNKEGLSFDKFKRFDSL